MSKLPDKGAIDYDTAAWFCYHTFLRDRTALSFLEQKELSRGGWGLKSHSLHPIHASSLYRARTQEILRAYREALLRGTILESRTTRCSATIKNIRMTTPAAVKAGMSEPTARKKYRRGGAATSSSRWKPARGFLEALLAERNAARRERGAAEPPAHRPTRRQMETQHVVLPSTLKNNRSREATDSSHQACAFGRCLTRCSQGKVS
jgi:hypothetical protein